MKKVNQVEETVTIVSAPAETVISAGTTFKGTIDTDKPITVEGMFEGEIKSTGIVTVSEGGAIKATVECAELLMHGTGEGSINCTGLVEFGTTGSFVGDVTTRDIVMGAGAKLEGQCKIG